MKDIKILGLESSCDDIGIGILSINHEEKILINEKFSKIAGKALGVIPEVVARSHLEEVKGLFRYCLNKCNLKIEDIDVFAVTTCPGLIGGLIVGTTFIKTIATLNRKIFIPIHHLEGHIFAADIPLPSLILLLSGGHSQLIYCQEFGVYKILATTLDDALGELFDKTGRLLGCNFPAGPAIEQLATLVEHEEFLPIPLKGKLSFSFSGLKTALARLISSDQTKDPSYFARLLQNTVVRILEEKVILAQQQVGPLPVVMCGGVAANKFIRHVLGRKFDLICPPIDLCTDNGLMIARAASHHIIHNTKYINDYNREAKGNCNLEDWWSITSI